MPTDTICKIVRQYNQKPVAKEDMEKLQKIAEDYGKVKDYVYQRYSGINSLSKLYPGYTVQNEMTRSGLRERMGMPSVYFYLAVFDALGEVKSQWTRTKSQVLKNTNRNQNLSDDEKHFIRYLLKVNNAFESVLTGSPLSLPEDIRNQYDVLTSCINVRKSENYVRRQVRKLHVKPKIRRTDGFSISERAYRYKDHGIYISVKEKRKRIFIPLTDGNSYNRQMYVRLFPEENRIELKVPVERAIKKHADYRAILGVSIGMRVLLVTDQGHRYGEKLGVYQTQLSDWIRKENVKYSKTKVANPGRKKYYAHKHRLEEQLHTYVNQELNRFLREEKPKVIYIPRLPQTQTAGPNKQINHYFAMWQRGYIRNRLALKCREQSVELVEVLGKDISRECSRCGACDYKKADVFVCPQCGYTIDRKQNSAENARKRGEDHKSG